jgi:putative flavoprotein involved in K+ transport
MWAAAMLHGDGFSCDLEGSRISYGHLQPRALMNEREGVTMADQIETVIVGGGQAGLSVGYHLQRRQRPFLILEGRPRVGDSWRERWDSLRLFSPSQFDGIDGMPFPAPSHSFPTKDEMAAYLESYAARFDLPVRTGARVERVARSNGGFLVTAGDRRIEAKNVVIAMASYQQPRIPSFSRDLDPSIVQLHSSQYRGPSQLRDGPVLVVGTGNSGAEIAKEVVRTHPVWLAGREVGEIPFRIEGALGRRIVRFIFRVVFHRVLTVNTPMGRKARGKILGKGQPRIRVKAKDLDAAGVERAGRVVGVRDGLPLLEDGRTLPATNVVWCTGFHPGFTWIESPCIGQDGEPAHRSGIVADEPGLFFVGLHFLHSLSSTMIHGVSRDAERIAEAIARR